MNFSVRIKDQNEGARVTLSEREGKNGVLLVDVDVSFAEPQVPSPISVCFSVPCVDMYSTWGATLGTARNLAPGWNRRKTCSRLASGAPLHQVLSFGGRNRLTVALSDAMTPTEISTGVVEETAELYCEVKFFSMPVNRLSSYHATVYIDRGDRPYGDALKAAERYWTEECGYPGAYIPDAARRPMYSCWYSFHQHIDVDAIVAQCRLAKAMGMDSVIVDDGWQTEDNSRGYAFCGDWEVAPSKVPDMKAFVDRVHETGMKFILWYSVPFMGKRTKAFARFRDMVLGYPTAGKTYASLDPRFPRVREYLIDTYRHAAEAWGIDGFKLDFIDSFKLLPETPTFDERWDTLSLEEGVDRLLKGITDALRAINPEMLIEFRQSYFGPTIRKYGNMIRVADCPGDSFMNHLSGTDLRFCLGSTPVHSDMLMWNANDSVEAAAYQVVCTLFTVPQISVLLDKIPEAHRKMLNHYLGFWNENREVLLDGDFSAENPESLYSLVKSEKDGHIIAVAHAKTLLTVDNFQALHFINASDEKALVLRTTDNLGERTYRVFDCMGNLLAEDSCDFTAGIREFAVPHCGMLTVE